MVRVGNESSNSDSIKFLCSYGGQILPRHSDYKLRYVGGYTRVLSIDRCVSYTGESWLIRTFIVDRLSSWSVVNLLLIGVWFSFAELMVKLVEFCGFSATLKCHLPNQDLDTLISVKTDEELATVVGEYDRAAARMKHSSQIQKIRAVLSPLTNLKKVSPPLSTSSSVHSSPSYGFRSSLSDDRRRRQAIGKSTSRKNNTVAIGFPASLQKSCCISPCYYDHRLTGGFYSGSCCNYLARSQQGMRLSTHWRRIHLDHKVHIQDRTEHDDDDKNKIKVEVGWNLKQIRD